MICFYQLVEIEQIISQIVGVSDVCDQNGDRITNNDKSCRVCSMRRKRLLVKKLEIWDTVFLLSFSKVIIRS